MVQSQHRNLSTRIRTAAITVSIGVLLLSVLFAAGLKDSITLSTSASERGDTGPTLAQTSVSRMLKPVKSLLANYWGRSASTASGASQTANLSNRISKGMAGKAPVYFVSHGVSTLFPHIHLLNQ